MFYKNVQAGVEPSKVLLERLPDGSANIRLADNITTVTDEEGTRFQYDEVAFHLDVDRTETEQDIERDFDDWWEYGTQPEEEPPTLEQRVSDLEDAVLALLTMEE